MSKPTPRAVQRTRAVNAIRLQELYADIGGPWVAARVSWEARGLVSGFWGYGLPDLCTDGNPRRWLGKTFARAKARVRAHRYRYLKPERRQAADKVAAVVISVAEAVKAVAD